MTRPADTLVVLTVDGQLLRGAEAKALLTAHAFTHAWRCFPGGTCYAPDGLRCDCASGSAGHDPGDESQ